jgi:hypothetical protein
VALRLEGGRTEILYRRIGSNELDAIEACQNYVEAQHEYALEKHDGSSLNQYAQKIISTEGKQDGLVWSNPDGTFGGPLGEELARVDRRGLLEEVRAVPRLLFQGPEGPGPRGAAREDRLRREGVMIGGFALVAAPADYRVTGVKTFIVSHDGVVYEKDLGPKTIEAVQEMELYNPDKTWSPVEEPSESPETPEKTGT